MYDFKALSPNDFEILVRDLLQAEWGVRLESFRSGRDKGIDLRFAQTRPNQWVVQCKQFAESPFSALVRAVRAEVPKIDKLAPARYVLVTAVRMTPERKEKLTKLIGTYCKGTQDILGCEDLNNLLGRHREVERDHFKLWLSRTSVLQRVLHSGLFGESQAALDRAKTRFRTYVHNSSYRRALKILQKHRVCIIAGPPGIGKTTLADILLVRHAVWRYSTLAVSSDIRDARNGLVPGQKTLVYYDDFLRKTALVPKLAKNEDRRLVDFIEDVRKSNNMRLILTTREYILEQAKTQY